MMRVILGGHPVTTAMVSVVMVTIQILFLPEP